MTSPASMFKAGKVDEGQRSRNRNESKLRSHVEHVFAVVKRLRGLTKVRYRGLANIYLARKRLLA